jgi:RNA polymerase sigma factor (sigma-70 family)
MKKPKSSVRAENLASPEGQFQTVCNLKSAPVADGKCGETDAFGSVATAESAVLPLESILCLLGSELGVAWLATQRMLDSFCFSAVMNLLTVDALFSCVVRLAQKENDSAKALVTEYLEVAKKYDWLERYLQSVGVWEADVVDQRQVVAERVAQSLPSLRDIRAFDMWIKRVAGTVARSYRRRHQRECELSAVSSDVVSSRRETNQLHMNNQIVLEKAWGRLSSKSRELLALNLEGRSVTEIAEYLCVSRCSAKAGLSRARKELRSYIS